MSRFNTLRMRLVLWSMLVNAALLFLLGIAVWWGLRRIQLSQIDNTLQLSAAQLVAAIDNVDGRLTVPADDAAALTNRSVFAWLINSNGQVDSTIGRAAKLPLPVLTSSTQDLPLNNAGTFRVYQQAIGEIKGTIVVGISLEPIEQTSQAVAFILAIAIPAALLISAAGAAFLAGRALTPIARITAQAQRISHENLSERLSVTHSADEVGQLAHTLDNMLDRLQAAFDHERHFIADASHELRTPLSLLKAQISLALNRPRDAVTFQQMIQAMDTDVDRMIRLVETMLLLMRTEATPVTLARVDLSELLDGLIKQCQPIAAERKISLTLEKPIKALICGDSDLLLRLFLNLLDNALKYTPVGGRITVQILPFDKKWQITTVDTGAGIPLEHLPHLFDRFYRADPSRTRQTGGIGLGLAIAQAIARQHGGQISVESRVGLGTTFRVILPGVDETILP